MSCTQSLAEFTIDLLIDPATRGVDDVAHIVAAIASSSGEAQAETFKTKVKAPAECAVYGSYEELFADANVDIIYIASPHSHHFKHTMMALKANKHVVCEKPITVNSAQAKILYETAKARDRFLLDAVWTRYFPLSIQIRDLISKGEIGEVLRVVADTSMGEEMDDLWLRQKRRKVNLDLAGGALLESKLIINLAQTYYFADRPQLASTRSRGFSKRYTTHCHLTSGDRLTTLCLTWSSIRQLASTKTRPSSSRFPRQHHPAWIGPHMV